MFHYVYVHKDARQAHGLSTWVALAKVLGRDEAHAVLDSAPPLLWGRLRTPKFVSLFASSPFPTTT